MMHRLSSADDIVVVGDETSNPFDTELASGECLLIASDPGWNEKQSQGAHTLRIAQILRLFDNGQLQKPLTNSSLWEFYGRVIKSTGRISLSQKGSQGSTDSRRLLNNSPASSSTSCPTLASDISTHREPAITPANPPTLQMPPRLPVDSSFTSAANTTEPPAPLPIQEEPEPLVLASVRQVLTQDPLYAEEVVLRLKKLPVAKRDILFNQYLTPVEDDAPATTHSSGDTPTPQSTHHSSTTNLEIWKASRATSVADTFFKTVEIHSGVSGAGLAPANVSESPHQVPQGQSSQAQCGKTQTRKRRVQNSSGGKSNKRAKLPDDGGDNEGDDGDYGDGSGSGGGGAASTVTDQEKKSNRRWACPYCLAFTHMLDVAKFKSCRPPGSLNSRSLWKDHLKEYHSPEARLSNPNADHSLFYMDDEQWAKVQVRIANGKGTRPRKYDEWFEVQKKCFLEVWRIIFPETRHPYLSEPLSPFHPDSSSLVNIGPRISTLLETMRNARARRAVDTGSIATAQDFRPTDEEYMRMITDALTIMTLASPGISQWVANVSHEGLQAAVLVHGRATQRAEAENADSEVVISPDRILGTSPESNLSDDPSDPAVPVFPIMIPLCPAGTQIYLEVSPNYATEPSRQPALLEAIPPQGFYINGLKIVATSPLAPTTGSGMAVPPPAPILSSPREPGSYSQFIDPGLLETTGDLTYLNNLDVHEI